MFTITESQGRTIDAWCKMIATVALVLGGGWSVFSYVTSRSDLLRNTSIEARKPIFEKQLDGCIEAVAAINKAVKVTPPKGS